MAKTRDQGKNKREKSKKRGDGSADIKHAEERLASALAGVDDARKKVARRERDLAALMERHGRTARLQANAGEAIPLNASSQATSENGAAQVESQSADSEGVEEQIEQPAAADGAEHHG